MDLYQILGITRDSSHDKIKKAYRELAMKYHPDKNKDPSAEDKFKEISRAYSILSDKGKRERYNLTGETDDNWSDSESESDSEYDYEVRVSYQELILGATKNVKVTEDIMLNMDNKEIFPVKCPVCYGKGKVKLKGFFKMRCGYCEGTGGIYNQECQPSEKVHEIELIIEPKSWIDRIINVKGKKIILRPSSDTRFRHEDNLLIYSHPITVFHSLIGLTKDIPILDKVHKINHPDPIMPSDHVVFPNAGLYDSEGHRHDLIIKFDILYPTEITEEQRKLIERCIHIYLGE